ncbi:MAG TPA: zinc ribbon domain-containing protein [Thermoleophilaceae bacterium]
MPIYEFSCDACGTAFEELTRADELPPCPSCGAPEPRRVLSQVAPTPRIGLRGAEARRSDATRRAREERKREERAARKGREGGG